MRTIALLAIALAGHACSAWQPLLPHRRKTALPARRSAGRVPASPSKPYVGGLKTKTTSSFVPVKKRKKVDRETAWAEKKAREEEAKQRRRGGATDIVPAAVVANGVPIAEDHRFEQFFYDAATSAKMMRLVRRFEKPLLVCVPSIAAKLDAAGADYLLLDLDERFATLKSFEPFDLRQPKRVEYAFDALFLDPPFANVTPEELATAVAALCGSRKVPIFVGYNLQRADELVEAFGAFDLRDTGDVLGYATGVMGGRIGLFTNWRP